MKSYRTNTEMLCWKVLFFFLTLMDVEMLPRNLLLDVNLVIYVGELVRVSDVNQISISLLW